MVLSIPIFWNITINGLAVSFTFFGLETLGTHLEKVIIQSIANLEK